MKNQIQSMLVLIVASLITFTACKKDQHPAFTNTSFILTTTEKVGPGSYIGYFTSSGDPTTSGTWTMQSAHVPGDSIHFHCSQTV